MLEYNLWCEESKKELFCNESVFERTEGNVLRWFESIEDGLGVADSVGKHAISG